MVGMKDGRCVESLGRLEWGSKSIVKFFGERVEERVSVGFVRVLCGD